jgi:hypothetical protein
VLLKIGGTSNHKRVWRVYRLMQLNRRRRGKKRLPNRHPMPLVAGDQINSSWSIDFMSDALWDGRRFRTFNVIDDFSREALAVEVDLDLPATRVIRTLEHIAACRGYPTNLRLDNGPEFIALPWLNGRNAKASSWTSSSPSGQCSTDSLSASTVAPGVACLTWMFSATSPKYESKPSDGSLTTTTRFPMTASMGSHPPSSEFRTTRQLLI